MTACCELNSSKSDEVILTKQTSVKVFKVVYEVTKDRLAS